MRLEGRAPRAFFCSGTVSAAKKHAICVPPQKCSESATTLSSMALHVYHSRTGSQSSLFQYRLAARLVSDWPLPCNFIK